MDRTALRRFASMSRFSLLGFLAVELVCVGGFLISSSTSRSVGIALLFLVGPLQLLAWLFLLQDRKYVLVYFAALLPAVAVELVPHVFWRYLYFPVTLVMLFLFLKADFLLAERAESAPVAKGDAIPLVMLILSLMLSSFSAVVHGWANGDLWFHVTFFAETLAMLYFFAILTRTKSEVIAVMTAFSVMLVVTVSVMMLLPAPTGEGGMLGGKIVTTPFGEASLNLFGALLSAGAAFMIGLVFQSERMSIRVVVVLGLLVVLVMLVLTKSRGAWLGLGVALVYILMRVRSVRLWWLAAGGSVLLLSFDALRQVLLVRAAETSISDPSLVGRVLLWTYAWKVGSANWLLGVGFEHFRFVKHFYGFPEPLSYAYRYGVHNLFIEILVDLGVLGFIGFSWLYLRTLNRLDAVVRSRQRGEWGVALGLNSALLAYGAHGLFDSPTWHPGGLGLLGMLLGLGVSYVRLCRECRESE
jgi:O-antigen ligase